LKSCDIHSANPQSSCSWDNDYLMQLLNVANQRAGMKIYVCSEALRNFVVKSTVAIASGSSVSVVVSPAVITAGQFQNVSIPTTSATAAVTQFNKIGTVSPQNIIMHRNAFTLAVADLELPEGVHFAGRASDKEIGLSMRVVRQYTINNDSIPTRLDVLYGWAPLYPELACRVAA
jgi:hypothetical protein